MMSYILSNSPPSVVSILNLDDSSPQRQQRPSASAGASTFNLQPNRLLGDQSTLDIGSDCGRWSPQSTPTGSPGNSKASQSSASSPRGYYSGRGQIRTVSGGGTVRSLGHMTTPPAGRRYPTNGPSQQMPTRYGPQNSFSFDMSGLSTPPSTPPSSIVVRSYMGYQGNNEHSQRPSSQRSGYEGVQDSTSTNPEHTRCLPSVREISRELTYATVNQPTYQPSRINAVASQIREAYRDGHSRSATFSTVSRRPPMSPEPEDLNDAALRRGRADCWVPDCKLDSPDRRVVSHFFGRNKKETRAIPEECWVPYCRQHYQRSRYQRKIHEFADLQMSLVKRTVKNLEAWGNVLDWTVTIRKRMLDQIAREDALLAAGEAHLIEKPCQERILLPYCGDSKSFADVYNVIGTVRDFAWYNDCEAMEFEIVPQFRPGFVEKRTMQRRATKMPIHSKGASSSSSGSAHSEKTVEAGPALAMSSKGSSRS